MRYFICLAIVLLAACSKPKSSPAAGEAAPAPIVDDAVIIAEQSDADTLKGSLRAKALGSVGKAQITVRYHSPAVRGRIVWGGLVPYDKVWVTGAHMATSLESDVDLSIAGQILPAGKYAFFTIPGPENWTLLINSNWQQHLTDDYDAKLDLVRQEVKPVAREVHQERLQYSLVQDDERNGRLIVRWEKLEVSLLIRVAD